MHIGSIKSLEIGAIKQKRQMQASSETFLLATLLNADTEVLSAYLGPISLERLHHCTFLMHLN